MTTVVLVEASPRDPATGAAVPYRLAGGGSRPYLQVGFNDWRAGIATRGLRVTTAFDFGEGGFTGGAVPQSVGLRFYPADAALLYDLANLYWPKAAIQVRTGNDESSGASYGVKFKGKVTAARCGTDGLSLTLADLSTDLAKPVCPDTFAGTGGLEGDAEAEGRVKRRSWGRAFNVEGRLLDKATLVYEFGDPGVQGNQITAVRDKGVVGTPTFNVGWQGSALATLNALKAATVPSGGYVTAHGIQCARWYTTPVGPLTGDLADASGDIYPATVAKKIVTAFSSAITLANEADAIAWQKGPAGIHVDSASETVGQALDRLLTFASTLWVVTTDGSLYFRRAFWVSPVASYTAETIEREAMYAPTKTRKLGYAKNHRVMSDSEVSAALSADAKTAFTEDAAYVVRDVAGADAAWGDDAVTSTAVSPYAIRGDTSNEASDQAFFLKGPLARDRIVVAELLHDVIGQVVTITGTGYGYTGGANVFVIGVQEDEVLPISTLTVLKRL
jgi:hypothetical protein